MIVTGVMTIFQVWGWRPFARCGYQQFQWGAGVLSVMGISFTTLPIAQSVIATLKVVRDSAGHSLPRTAQQLQVAREQYAL